MKTLISELLNIVGLIKSWLYADKYIINLEMKNVANQTLIWPKDEDFDHQNISNNLSNRVIQKLGQWPQSFYNEAQTKSLK